MEGKLISATVVTLPVFSLSTLFNREREVLEYYADWTLDTGLALRASTGNTSLLNLRRDDVPVV
jgi:hypothetical protein